MEESINKVAFGLIVVGALLSLGRVYWSKLITMVYSKIKKQEKDERLRQTITIYLMLTGMIFTVMGLLGLFNIIEY